MPRDAYNKKLTGIQILELIDAGKYSVDIETGEIFSKRTGNHLFTYTGTHGGKHLWTRLYWQPYYKTLPVAHIIWIVGTRSEIPKGFEVHHRDENAANNAFTNLLCVHPLDHLKLHARINAVKEQVPF